MKTWKKCLVILFVASMIITGLPSNVQAASKSKIKLSKSKLTLSVGSTKTLKLKGTKKKPKWTSSKKSVATVTKKGKVKAKKKGSTVITAKLGKKKYKCKVTVKPVAVSQNTPVVAPTEKPITPTVTPTVKPSTLPEGTATVVPSESPSEKPTVAPTEAPTEKPTEEPVLPEDYQKLADYFTTEGTYDSDGEYYYINDTIESNTATLYSTIIYDPSDNSFEFGALVSSGDAESMISLVIAPPEFTKGDALHVLFTSDENVFYAEGEVILSSLTTTNSSITYTETNAPEEMEDDLYTLGDSVLGLGLKSWSSMLKEYEVGLSLKDLGFTSYEG